MMLYEVIYTNIVNLVRTYIRIYICIRVIYEYDILLLAYDKVIDESKTNEKLSLEIAELNERVKKLETIIEKINEALRQLVVKQKRGRKRYILFEHHKKPEMGLIESFLNKNSESLNGKIRWRIKKEEYYYK